MGLFPTDAIDGDQVTNDGGTTFEYDDVDDKWFIVNTVKISNTPYDEGTWDDNPDAASKNAIRDKLEVMSVKMYIEDALASDGDYEGIVLTITHSEAFGKAVYVSGNNVGADADKDAIGTMLAIGLSVGANKVLILGTIREDDWNWTANDTIFIGDDGAVTNDVSGYTAGDMVQVVGVAVDQNTILVKGLDWVEIV